MFRFISLASMCLLLSLFYQTVDAQAQEAVACHDLQTYRAMKLRSKTEIDFCAKFAGKPMLIVNTASQCGFTGQFKGLEALHKRFGDRLAIIGFPSNDFKQEYTDTDKVADVCYVNYGVTFTMLEPSVVTGKEANAVFALLAQKTGQQPSWNFNKYLVSANGQSVTHFGSRTKPGAPELLDAIDSVLNASD
ncbi:glutathione peroxidase [Arenicella chitinivorans]|uniref:Glutathione peroxidase n=1 Tax=Arenicella chitinivorans TaxID=1329800 RepID=A0A918VRC4_9GAMM|nr:glutathione peroxidase [Arenicella chitinivorans]GHA21826.1 glutathione peroxidase [Arenicella chitinivorans]